MKSTFWSDCVAKLKKLRGYHAPPLTYLPDGILEDMLQWDVEQVRLDNYLANIRTKFSPEHVGFVEAVIANTSALGLPVIFPTADEGIQCSWTKGKDHLSTDIYADGGADWFYRDRDTDFIDGGDYDLDSVAEVK